MSEKESKFICKGCLKEPTERINVMRFIDKLDNYFKSNNLVEAGKHIEFWESEARKFGDSCGLLSILNEELGFYRRTNEREKGLKAVAEVLELLEIKELTKNVSGATMYVNCATTLKCFGKAEEGLPLYDKAEQVFIEEGKQKNFEYASLLNNKATALSDLKKYNEAEKCINKAIEILKKDGKHDGEIAVSLINLAHTMFDRDDNAYEQVEKTLDLAWEYLNSENQPKDANYAYILTKCAPSLRYFQREIEAQAIEEIAQEIYEGKI